MTLDTRIAIGTKFLDEVKPGWAGQINLTELNLGDPYSCVLGQLFAEEGKARYVNGYTAGSFVLHDWLEGQGYHVDDYYPAAEIAGFERAGVAAMVDDEDDESYWDLQDAWVAVINR